MTWNYQIVKYTKKDYEGTEFAEQRKGAPFYAIHEVYYDENQQLLSRTMMPETFTWDSWGEDETDPVKAFCELLDQIKADILSEPILDEETAVYKGFGEGEGFCAFCEKELENKTAVICPECEADPDNQLEDLKFNGTTE